MEIIPLGDSALVVHVRENFGSDPQGALKSVAAVRRQIEAAGIPGVVELAPAYSTVGVFYDPVQAARAGAPVEDIIGWLRARIESAVSSPPPRSAKKEGRLVEIPVCYDAALGLDLGDVAHHARLRIDEVVRLHSGAEYVVACLGFMPGFAYLSGLPERLSTPRRIAPRTEVPAGAVAIGGAQTGIYPAASPGGWNIIGRTPLRMFDPNREEPALLRAGDRVRFRAIEGREFERVSRTGRSHRAQLHRK